MNMVWHEIQDPADPELDRLAERYGLHPLHVEDCRHRNQSAKAEENAHYLFTVLKPVERGEDGDLDVGDLDVIIGRDFVITVEEHTGSTLRKVLDRVRSAASGARPDQLLYRILDGVVDSYAPILDRFDDAIDALEDQVLADPRPEVLERIFSAKRGLIEMRRVLANTRDVAAHLQRITGGWVAEDMWPFFRDVYDHLSRSLDMVEMQRDLLNGSLDIYRSCVANRTTRVMKVLTVLGTVALPAVVVTSFYGMNLKGLPGAESPHGLVVAGGVIVLSTVILYVILKKFDWL
ncbi:MAG: magnesium transporter CorA family protein [Bryobacteraceae bacterium]